MKGISNGEKYYIKSVLISMLMPKTAYQNIIYEKECKFGASFIFRHLRMYSIIFFRSQLESPQNCLHGIIPFSLQLLQPSFMHRLPGMVWTTLHLQQISLFLTDLSKISLSPWYSITSNAVSKKRGALPFQQNCLHNLEKNLFSYYWKSKGIETLAESLGLTILIMFLIEFPQWL